MAFVSDSRFAGYLGPRTGAHDPNPMMDIDWENFLQEIVVGVTGLDPRLVWPRWQPEPPPIPDITVNWVSIGITNTRPDWGVAVIHVDDGGDGYDALQRQEHVTVLASFYGPNNQYYGTLFRDGLSIDQNRAVLRANACGVIEVGDVRHAPELFRQQWRDRSDIELVLNREIRYNYPDLNLLAAAVHMGAQPPGMVDDVLIRDILVGTPASIPGTTWDDAITQWDNGATVWDTP